MFTTHMALLDKQTKTGAKADCMPIQNTIFELCAPNREAAVAAERGGADRIELCSNLSVGGVTPDPLLLESVLAAISIPVYVLIRPREGAFVYSYAEFAQMRQQVVAAKAAGAKGVAIGVLLPDAFFLRGDGRTD